MPTLTIDSYIGQWGYSKQVVKNFLDENKNKDVTIVVSSLGGDYDHALTIHNLIAKHGKVTIEFEGFNASSATIIPLGAKKTKAASNSFYLIHKVASWVDIFGSLNEDDLQDAIDNLEKEKNENEKMTLVLAQMYIKKTGNSLQDTFSLMKENTWLTADEAKELGYIDEVYEPVTKTNFLQNKAAMALIAGNGMPSPKRTETKINTNTNKSNETKIDEEKLASSLFNKIASFFKTQKTNTVKELIALCSFLDIASIEVDEEKGAYINKKQLTSLNDKLNKFAELETQLNETKTAEEEAETAKTNAENELKTANEKIAELKKDPAAKGAVAQTEGDDPKKSTIKTAAKGENLSADIEAVKQEYL